MANRPIFVMPDSIDITDVTDTYAKFTIKPFETGFGHTIGNSFRRILLSSLEGAAVSAIKIDNVDHEFTAIPGVVEDVTEIVMNVKDLKLKCSGETPRKIEVIKEKAGPVLAGDISVDGFTKVMNPEHVICTIADPDKLPEKELRIEFEIVKGRGYKPSEENKRDDHPIGIIPIDCIFSPVQRVVYNVEDCRIGKSTDNDQLELQVWTDGRLKPQDAVKQAAFIFREHLSIFFTVEGEEDEPIPRITSKEDEELLKKLMMNVRDLDLSVRSENCLKGADIDIIGELVTKTETEMLKFRNFGKKSLDEIKERLEEMDIRLGATLKEELLAALPKKDEKGEY
ncbi:MAG: DNA-directed RNA polymerase subunit alpha [Verrucomicrobiota bacterium]|nr:DNA-directed RNA polymerase subunit alpha [Verrucomicrobiota bacterium]